MEIFFGLVVIGVKLIWENIAERRANKYADTVVRRYKE